MCLSIPAKVLKTEGDFADVDIGGNLLRIGIHLLENVKPGDYVLVHSGFALQVISSKEAETQLELIRLMKQHKPS